MGNLTSYDGIKVGDYIEGIENWGVKDFPEHKHTMRIIVKDIFQGADGKVLYSGKADDPWNGARGTSLHPDNGEIKIITEETPFSSQWWLKNKKVENIPTVMSYDRAMKLLNEIVAYSCIAENTQGAIERLVNIGFTPEELVTDFQFSQNDIDEYLEENNDLGE